MPGLIVWAYLDDPQGRNKKKRPAIVFDIDRDDNGVPFCTLIGGTTKPVDARLIHLTILLPGSNRHQGEFRTGLTEETRFCSFWLKDVYARSVIENTRVFCPESEFLELRNMIDSGL